MAGWGNLFGKIAEQFQGRVERLKNEKHKLIREKQKLQQGKCDEKVSLRITAIDDRIDVIDGLLESSAK